MSIPDPVLSLPDADILTAAPDSLMFLGNTRAGREIWLDRDAMTRHLLVVGTTGSGKSEFLLGMCANAMASGNGVLFVDGKGDIGTFARLYSLAERFGRRDDVLLLNFSQGVPAGEKSGRFLSNTVNPFLGLSSDATVQLLVSLMENVGGDGAMWKGRAIAMMTGVIRAATWLRDVGISEMTVGSLRDLCNLRSIVNLASSDQYPDMPKEIRKVVKAYLTSLPGYQEEKKEKQAQTTLDQHGYLEMQMTRLFSTLADVYGHIFDANSAHIQMKDVVINRRIVMVMLPVLEKSGEEVANLGRIVVALLKNMMSSAMHAPVEGTWKDVVEKRPTNAEYPFLVILDEVSHYMTDGMAAMAGQARSLGFCLVFATQDTGQMEESNRKETSAIIANTNLKIFMRLTNPFDLDMRKILPNRTRYENGRSDAEDRLRDRIAFQSERLSRVLRKKTGEREHDALAQAYNDLWSTYEEKDRLIADNPSWSLVGTVKSLAPGEFVAVYGEQFLLGRSLFVGAALRKTNIALNHFVRWDQDRGSIHALHSRTERNAQFLALLSTDPGEAFGSVALPFAAAYADKPRNAKASVRRAFAVVGHLKHLTAATARPAVKKRATRRLLALGD